MCLCTGTLSRLCPRLPLILLTSKSLSLLGQHSQDSSLSWDVTSPVNQQARDGCRVKCWDPKSLRELTPLALQTCQSGCPQDSTSSTCPKHQSIFFFLNPPTSFTLSCFCQRHCHFPLPPRSMISVLSCPLYPGLRSVLSISFAQLPF